MISTTVDLPDNPFPGLRPFLLEDSRLFFGRDGLSEELLSRLSEARFLAVIGTSGSGKSSLVRAGLLPLLLGGFMNEAGSDWRVTVMRPGNGPIAELAQALNEPGVLGLTIGDNEEAQHTIIYETLRRGTTGLVQIVRQAGLAEREENLLVVVDQFEELFRYGCNSSKSRFQKRAPFSAAGPQAVKAPGSSNNGKGLQPEEAEKYENEAATFVKLLLEAAQQDKIPIFVVVTMRSDYFADCAQFEGLPEAINNGQYLVPRLTREQQRKAITKPVELYGAQITPRLVTQLLNDIGDDSDQLPLLQHALMRTWKEGGITSNGKKLLDLEHYVAVGGMAEALSNHAEVAYDSLSDKQQKIAEKLFKCLTVRGTEGQEVRRPTVLKDICEIIDEEEEDVIEVIEVFRRRGRSFLMPPVSEPLESGSQIDISHESLIRCWHHLSRWVDEESQTAGRYQRLADTALLHKEKQAELLRGADAHFVLEWFKEADLNEAWAKRYHDADYNIVMAFLKESKELHEKELEAEETQRRTEIRRKFIKILKPTLSVASLLLLAVSILAIVQGNEAVKQRNAAEHRGYAAQLAVAQLSYKNGEYGAARAQMEWLKSHIEITLQQDLDDFAGFEWHHLWRLTHNERATLRGPHKSPIHSVAFSARDGQRIAAGREDGVVMIWERVGNEWAQRPDLKISSSTVTSIAFSPADEKLLAIGRVDGSIMLCDLGTGQEKIQEKILRPPGSQETNSPTGTVAFSPSGEMLAAGGTTVADGNEATINLWQIKLGSIQELKPATIHKTPDTPLIHKNSAPPLTVHSIAFSPLDGKWMAIGTSEGVKLLSMTTEAVPDGEVFKEQFIKELTIEEPIKINSVAFSPVDRNVLAIGGTDSKLRLWDIGKRKEIIALSEVKEISSVAFSKGGNIIALGSYDGSVRLWKTSTGGPVQVDESVKVNLPGKDSPLTAILSGHTARVFSVAFSPDGNTLVSGSNDGYAQLWDVERARWRDSEGAAFVGTMLKTHDDAILSLAYSPGGPLVSGSADASLKLTSIGTVMRSRDAREPKKLEQLIKDNSKAEPFERAVSAVSVSPSGKVLAAGSWDGSIRLWDLSRGGELKQMELPLLQQGDTQERIVSIAFSSDERMLAAGAVSNEREIVKVWQLGPRLESRRLLPISITGASVAFSPTDRVLLATGGEDNTMKLWDGETGELLQELKGHTKRILSVAFSPDGKLLASGSADSTAILWNVDTRERLATFQGHSNAISSLAFSSHNDRLATGSYDGTVKLWDTREQLWGASPPLELATLRPSSVVISLAFSRDNRALVAGSGDGYLWLWWAESEDLSKTQ
jgi:WD40 repeat protein